MAHSNGFMANACFYWCVVLWEVSPVESIHSCGCAAFWLCVSITGTSSVCVCFQSFVYFTFQEMYIFLYPVNETPSLSPSLSFPFSPPHSFLPSLPPSLFLCSTIIYELMNMSLPFHKTPGELIIWQVGNCHTQSLTHLHDGKLKEIVTQCWLPASVQRPSFKELLGTLEQNVRAENIIIVQKIL